MVNSKTYKTVLTTFLGLALISLLAWLVITPTTTVVLKNDTNNSIQASVCGSNPATVGANQSVDIDTSNNDPKEACAIYNMQDHYEGCLAIPTTNNKNMFIVSKLNKSVSEKDCGD